MTIYMPEVPDADTSFLAGKRILVVEDEFLISLDIEQTLESAGAEMVSFPRSRDALKALESGRFDLALLDYKLNGDTSVPVAERLAALNVPFVFLTGASSQMVPEAFRAIPVIAKPFDRTTLIETLRKATGRG